MKQKKMKKFWEWAASVDAIYVVGEFKGHGREDGYEAICYRSRSTGRYLIVTGTPRFWNHVWVANTEDDARQAYRQGYTPGNAPGRYHLVLAPERLREVRALRVNPEEGGKCDVNIPQNLTSANLSAIRDDLRSLLASAPHEEVCALRSALVEGLVDRTVYEGECASLVGIIARVRGCSIESLESIESAKRPVERWALAIRPGDTPASSQVVAITVGWIDEWIDERLRAD